jgi:hypothetical protein
MPNEMKYQLQCMRGSISDYKEGKIALPILIENQRTMINSLKINTEWKSIYQSFLTDINFAYSSALDNKLGKFSPEDHLKINNAIFGLLEMLDAFDSHAENK